MSQKKWTFVDDECQCVIFASHVFGPYIRFHTPIPIEFLEARMLVEEAAVPATHMSIADHPAFSNANSTQILETVHESALINPIWQ